MAAEKPRVQTVEATSKRWKAVQLLGGLATVIGIAVGVLCFRNPAIVVGSIVLASIGLAVHIVGKLGAWWYHG